MRTTTKTGRIFLFTTLILAQVGCTLPKTTGSNPSSAPPPASPPVVQEPASAPAATPGPGGPSATPPVTPQQRGQVDSRGDRRQPTEAEARAAVERTRADQAALENAERDYRVQRETGSMNGSDASDYAVYIAGLRRKLAEDCLELLERGIEIPDDLDCDLVRAEQTAASREQRDRAARANAERTQELDEELRESLGEFDEAMIRGPIRVGDGRGRTTADTGYDSDGYDDLDDETASDAQGRATESTSAADNEPESDGTENETDHAALGSSGKDAAPGKDRDAGTVDDDDIVARQLREAAEKETDPELKEKLWEEYRRYKKGVS